MRLAVIDLGTNTCNLLIAEYDKTNYKILQQGKVGVKIGKSGIHKNQITDEAFVRAKNAIDIHLSTINDFNVDEMVAIGTSAVRDAANKDVFCKYLLDSTGIELKVISGEEEATLIFKGVQLAMKKVSQDTIILDIGGGSNEFIIPNHSVIKWKESFPLGISRILELFTLSDPITNDEIAIIENYFQKNMQSLWEQASNQNFTQLIGCSGAFDTLADLIDQTAPGTKTRVMQLISIEESKKIFEEVISSTKNQREQMTGMEPLRIEMIVPAFIFIRLVAQKLNIKSIIQTDYALREGVLYDRIYN